MKKFIKNTTILLAVIILTAVFDTGCGKDSTPQDKNSITKEETEKHQPLSITSFNNLITQDFIDAFNEKYPEVTFNIQSYAGINGSGYAAHSLENGDIPDIYVSSQNFNKEAQEKYLLDLSNYSFINNYSSMLLDSVDINGSVYLLPSGYQLTGIYYNKTILEENGWKVPESFNELVALSHKIKKAGYKTMGNGMALDGFPFNYFFNIGNTRYFSTPEGADWKENFPKGEAKAEGNKELQKTAEYFNKWVENGLITTKHTETSEFYEGECVFFLCLGLNEYEYTTKDGKKYEFGTISWLSEDGSNNMLTRTVSKYIGINKDLEENSQKLEDALKLLDYISTVEGQEKLMAGGSYYMTSLNKEELPEDSPYKELEETVHQGRIVPLVYVGWEKLIIPVAKDIKKLIEGKYDVDTF